MNRIKELRENARMTQDELGALLTCGKATISKYEHGYSDLHSDTLIKLSRIFDVSIDYVLGLSPVKEPLTYTQFISGSYNPSIFSDSDESSRLFCLSKKEYRILEYYKRLNEENQDCVKGYILDSRHS